MTTEEPPAVLQEHLGGLQEEYGPAHPEAIETWPKRRAHPVSVPPGFGGRVSIRQPTVHLWKGRRHGVPC